jgi:hypothetical protein
VLVFNSYGIVPQNFRFIQAIHLLFEFRKKVGLNEQSVASCRVLVKIKRRRLYKLHGLESLCNLVKKIEVELWEINLMY